MPEIEARRISASASASVASGKMVIGSTTMPLSKRLTLRTSSAWSAGVKVAVDDADAARLRHRDGEPRLRHRVHRRGDDRQVEADRAGQPRADVDEVRHHRAVAGTKENVVEGEALRKRCVFQCRHGEPSPRVEENRGRLSRRRMARLPNTGEGKFLGAFARGAPFR